MTTERWTDERLDRLASTAESNTQQIQELRVSITELRESSREQHQDISALQITATALLQLAQQQQAFENRSREEWDRTMALHRETDQRFEVLLAEVRHLISRLDGNEG